MLHSVKGIKWQKRLFRFLPCTFGMANMNIVYKDFRVVIHRVHSQQQHSSRYT
jgi:hypothetical protein